MKGNLRGMVPLHPSINHERQLGVLMRVGQERRVQRPRQPVGPTDGLVETDIEHPARQRGHPVLSPSPDAESNLSHIDKVPHRNPRVVQESDILSAAKKDFSCRSQQQGGQR